MVLKEISFVGAVWIIFSGMTHYPGFLFHFTVVARNKGETLCSVCDKLESTHQNEIVVCASCFHGNFFTYITSTSDETKGDTPKLCGMKIF